MRECAYSFCEEDAEGLSTFERVSDGVRESQARCFDHRRSCNKHWAFVSWQGFTADADALHVDSLGWVP